MASSNRHAYALLALAFTLAAPVFAAEGDPFPPDDMAQETLVYVGTKAGGEGRGVYAFWVQTKNLEVSQNITLVPIGLAAETPNAVFLEVDAKRRLVFVLNDVEDFDGAPGGAVSAFAVQAETGKLSLLNQRSSMGAHPCHLALDEEAGRLLVANCGGGNVTVLPIGSDGKLGEPASVVEAASPACVVLSPDRRHVFVCGGETNTIQGFRYDAAQGTLASTGPPVHTSDEAAVRRLVFRPDGKFAYALNAASSTITAFSYDAAPGALAEIQTSSTVPPYYDGPNRAAELGIRPDGKFLYVSNDGHNSIVLFTVADSGELSYVEEQGVGGKNPLHFGIQPSAEHLTIANQDSDSLLICRIDAGNGRLKPSGVFASSPSPTVAKFLPPAEEQ